MIILSGSSRPSRVPFSSTRPTHHRPNCPSSAREGPRVSPRGIDLSTLWMESLMFPEPLSLQKSAATRLKITNTTIRQDSTHTYILKAVVSYMQGWMDSTCKTNTTNTWWTLVIWLCIYIFFIMLTLFFFLLSFFSFIILLFSRPIKDKCL